MTLPRPSSSRAPSATTVDDGLWLFLPVAAGSYGLFTANHVYEAAWSDRVQTGGQVEHGIPTGIPTKNQKISLR